MKEFLFNELVGIYWMHFYTFDHGIEEAFLPAIGDHKNTLKIVRKTESIFFFLKKTLACMYDLKNEKFLLDLSPDIEALIIGYASQNWNYFKK